MKAFGQPLTLHFRKFSMSYTMCRVPMSLGYRIHRRLEIELVHSLSPVHRHHRHQLVRALILQGPEP